MTIKYEPVFGDQSLFYNAQADCEMVGNGHHKVEHGKLMVWNFLEKYWVESHTDKITVEAMRRVIKTPTWTRADQEAEVLPPVGAKVGVLPSFIAEVMVTSAEVSRVCVRFDDGEIDVVSLEQIYPIETPEEKAQREQEEFVASFNSEKYSNPTLYREGLRDAYRKLKAPTND